jgi:hypothetical protein
MWLRHSLALALTMETNSMPMLNVKQGRGSRQASSAMAPTVGQQPCLLPQRHDSAGSAFHRFIKRSLRNPIIAG